jgi:PPM family protein phosphatase
MDIWNVREAIVTQFFQKKFGRTKTGKTEPLVDPALSTFNQMDQNNLTASLLWPVASSRSTGKQRDHNEDSMFALSSTIANENDAIPFGLYIVADGMGGHKHGEVASGIAVRSFSSFLIQNLLLPNVKLPPKVELRAVSDLMQEAAQEAHEAILRFDEGCGTTLTAALLLGDEITVAHVGDSRAYFITPGGQVTILTRDHSFVKRLVELGQITNDEAAIHPQRNVLYKALGQGDPFDADIVTETLSQGYLLVCSDGLWGVVPEDKIIQIITSTPSLDLGCRLLVDAANQAGGPDNITAILVQIAG